MTNNTQKLTVILVGIVAIITALLIWQLKPNNPPTATQADISNLPSQSPKSGTGSLVHNSSAGNATDLPVISTQNTIVAAVAASAPKFSPTIVNGVGNPDNSVYGTGLPADKNDPVKLEKRQQVFGDLAQFTTGMSQATASNPEQVLKRCDELVSLTQDGYVPKQDAINQLIFLQKAMPHLSPQLQQRLVQLEK